MMADHRQGVNRSLFPKIFDTLGSEVNPISAITTRSRNER